MIYELLRRPPKKLLAKLNTLEDEGAVCVVMEFDDVLGDEPVDEFVVLELIIFEVPEDVLLEVEVLPEDVDKGVEVVEVVEVLIG